MKKFLLIACALAAAIWAVTLPLACGPETKFCPPNGECPKPIKDSGAAGSGGGGDSLVID